MELPTARAPKGTCYAPVSSSVRCGAPSVATIKYPVPGGTLSGHACLRHVEFVRHLVHEEALRRGASPIGRFRPEDVEAPRTRMIESHERDHSVDTVSDDAPVVIGSLDESLWES